MRIQAVIFDLDETLVNNLQNHITASEKVFAPFQKGKKITEENPAYHGMRVSDVMKDIMRKLKIPKKRFTTLFQSRQQIFLSLVEKNCAAMPGMHQILSLVDQLGLKKALASSGTREYIHLALKKLKLTRYFDAVVSGEELKHGKPHPETFLVAAKKLGIDPDDCLVIEDAKKGVIAAKRAGMTCIGVHYPKQWNKKLGQNLSRADFEVGSLAKITKAMLT